MSHTRKTRHHTKATRKHCGGKHCKLTSMWYQSAAKLVRRCCCRCSTCGCTAREQGAIE